MTNSANRTPLRSAASTALLLGCLAVASITQLGCQPTHEPPELDAAAMEQKYQEQMKLREIERGGKS
ncbi:MAG TPA: hypothetical protein VGN57_09545 [Pirellulaceae bacterium]|jgi:hypothetical protein|nr:hypothetical protein [Pirellulaceae bacterium]